MEGNRGHKVLERTPLFILDASVAVKWFVREPLRDKALQVRKDYAEGKIDLLAPSLIRYEIGNALRFHPGSSPRELADAVNTVSGMQIDDGELSPEIVETASEIAFQEKLTFYDGIYLALAEKHVARLLTDDRKLYREVRKRSKLLQLLADYESPP